MAIVHGLNALKGFKYADEVCIVVKRGEKEILIAAENGAEAVSKLLKGDEVIGYAVRQGDEIVAGVAKNGDEVAEAGSDAGKVDEVVEGRSKTSTGIENLLNNRAELTGTTREKLLSTVQDSELAKIVNELYRPGAIVGDGGTASILVEEI